MRRSSLVRTAALALVLYGVLGFFVGGAMALVGWASFAQVQELQRTLDRERASLAQSLRTVSRTLGNTAGATSDFQRSLDGARDAAGTAADLAVSTGSSFRGIAQALNIQIFGLQPFAGLVPQFAQSADQLDQLSTTLATTRDSLNQNREDVRRVGADLAEVQVQVNGLATTLDRSASLVTPAEQLLPFQVAFYGMSLLFALQSLFSLLAGLALVRQQETFATLAEMMHHHRHARGLAAEAVSPGRAPVERQETPAARPSAEATVGAPRL